MSALLSYAMLSGVSLIAILDPVAAAPTFLAMTTENTARERILMAGRACATAAGVLILFAVAGKGIFRVFGITLPSFQIAGGLILLLVSLDSLRAKRSAVQETDRSAKDRQEDISITPGRAHALGPGPSPQSSCSTQARTGCCGAGGDDPRCAP